MPHIPHSSHRENENRQSLRAELRNSERRLSAVAVEKRKPKKEVSFSLHRKRWNIVEDCANLAG